MKEQKNSRSAGTETTANAKPRKILHRHYNTNQRKKQVIFATVLFVVFLTACSPCKSVDLVPIQHKVRQGETLWSISAEYKPDCMTMDEYMSFVYKNNKGGVIYPGDIVVVGVYEN